MTIDKTIQMARMFLKGGNGGAYARLLSGCIRASVPNGIADKKYRTAIIEDGAERFFIRLETACPVAAE